MSDWRKAVRAPISYTVTNEVVRLQRTFVTVISVLGTIVLLISYSLLPSKSDLVKHHHLLHDDHIHTQRRPIISESSTESLNPLCKSPSKSYNRTYPLSKPEAIRSSEIRYRIGLIADLDFDSKDTSKNSTSVWRSYLLKGYLTVDTDSEDVKINWDKRRIEIQSKLSSNDRGMELSELIVFNGKLYTCDDRTGIIYQILQPDFHHDSSNLINEDMDGHSHFKQQQQQHQDDHQKEIVVPFVILNNGDGKSSSDGFKCEWMSVKDDQLYVGGLGKEWTHQLTGELISHDPQWIKIIRHDGSIQSVNWRSNYESLRSAAGIQFPGYMIHESGVWSSIHKKWFFLPRRASSTGYNENDDERKGTNLLMTTDENFTEIEVKTIGPVVPTHGFSSFKFIPGTNDRLIVAIKSMEDKGYVATFITAFNIDGTILLPETKIDNAHVKYEGLEFI